MKPSALARLNAILPGLFLLALLVLPAAGPSSRLLQLITLCGINVLLAQSINLLTGYAGEISLGHAGFYGIGAYTTAVLAVRLHWPLWLSVPAAVLAAALVGLLVAFPAERVKEFYLAMVTLGFGTVAYEVMQQWRSVTGGFMGMSNIPSPVLRNLHVFGVPITMIGYYEIVLVSAALFTWLLSNLVRSHIGRSFVAVAGSELAAQVLGIRQGATKHLTYVLSAALAGLAGALYAHQAAFISPEAFSIWASVAILVMPVFGGMRTLVGPILGAAFFTFVPEYMQMLKDFQLLVYGALLLLSYLILPRGIAGAFRTRTGFISRAARREVELGAVVTAGAGGTAGKPTAQAPPQAVAPVVIDGAGGAAAPLLEVAGVGKDFAGLRALSSVSMAIRPGSIHGLIGPNGSGKTTLVNIISGVYKPTTGVVRFRGREIQGLPPYQVARLGIARAFQDPRLFPDMTVRENVLTGAYRHFDAGLLHCSLATSRARREEVRLLRRTEAIMAQVGLGPYADELASNLPYGQKRLCEVARTLNAGPDLLILDEPAAGLSEAELEQLSRLLIELRRQGITILLIEHHMDFLFDLVEAVTVLDHGERIFDGLPTAARKDPQVIKAYLGRYADAGD